MFSTIFENKIWFMRKILVLMLCFCLTAITNGQSIKLIPNPDTSAVGFDGYNAIEYNGSLYATYLNKFGKRQLAKCSNKIVTLINNPDTGSISVSSEFVVYNNQLFFTYSSTASQNDIQIAKYNGSVVTLFVNPAIHSLQLFNKFEIYKNKLFINFLDSSTSEVVVHSFNGITFTKINTSTDFIILDNKPFVFKNKLHFKARLINFPYYHIIASYNDTTFAISDTSNFKKYLEPIWYDNDQVGVEFNNEIYFVGGDFSGAEGNGIVKFNGTRLVNVITDTVYKTNTNYTYPFIISNNKLYFSNTVSLISPPYTSKGYLMQFDGTSLVAINRPDSGSGLINNDLKLYSNMPFFSYSNVNNQIQLAYYNGSNINLIPNQDSLFGIINTLMFNNKLYLFYNNINGLSKISRYNDTSFIYYQYPDKGEPSNFGIGYEGTVYCSYINAKGTHQIGYFSEEKFIAPNPCFPIVTITNNAPTAVCYGTKITYTATTTTVSTAVKIPVSGKLFIVGNATLNGWANPVPLPTQEFARKDVATFVGVFDLIANREYVLLPVNGDWATTYFLDDSKTYTTVSGSFKSNTTSGGINFKTPTTSGKYLIEINFYSGTYTLKPYTLTMPTSLFIAGSATLGGWANPVPVPSQQFTKVNSCTYEITLPLTSNNNYIWLPTNGSWATKFSTPNSSLVGVEKSGSFQKYTSGGDDFKSPLANGTYRIKANFADYKYEVLPSSIPNIFDTSYTYKWFKNGIKVGTNKSTFSDSLLNTNDSIWCVVVGNSVCGSIDSAASNILGVVINYSIKGNIVSIKNNSLIRNVKINLNGVYRDSILSTTSYNFNCLPSYGILRPTKNNDIKKNNGVSSIDVILVQNHILNKIKLNSPYKIIAADVNNNKSISNIDVIFMKRLILGIDTTFTGNRLWTFVDSSYQFPDTTNPFPYKDSISFTNLASNKTNQTFIGVKLGDVNYDWNPLLARGNAIENLQLIMDDGQWTTNNEQIKIPISVKNFKGLTALQYTLHFDNSNYEFVTLEGFKNLQGFEYNARQANKTGNISFLWADAKGDEKTLEDGTEIFTLVFKARKLGTSNMKLGLALTNDITEIETWDKNYLQHPIILTKREKPIVNTAVSSEQWSVNPNPTSGEITVNMQCKLNKSITINLTNAGGKTLYQQVFVTIIGNNVFKINLKKQHTLIAGVYYLKAIGLNDVDVKKIVVKQ